MTIEQKALELVNAVRDDRGYHPLLESFSRKSAETEALCRAIEQHEAFRQEVSDAVEKLLAWPSIRSQAIIASSLSPFILAKPDPLEDVLSEAGYAVFPDDIERLRAALEARGLAIVKKEAVNG